MSDKPSENARALVGFVVDHFSSYFVSTRHPSQSLSGFLAEVRQELAQANHDRRIKGMTVVLAYELHDDQTTRQLEFPTPPAPGGATQEDRCTPSPRT